MSSTARTTGLPFSAQVELADMSDGLKRWARLRLLREKAQSEHGSEDQSALDDAISAALPAAQSHAKALTSFYRKNGDYVNAMIAAGEATSEEARSRAVTALAKLGDDPAAVLADGATSFSTHGDGLCDALWNLMMES